MRLHWLTWAQSNSAFLGVFSLFDFVDADWRYSSADSIGIGRTQEEIGNRSPVFYLVDAR